MPALNHVAVQLALRAAMAGLVPAPIYANDNRAFTPIAGQEYVREQLVPATQTLRGLTAAGYREHTGLYVLTWYGLADTGLAVATNADRVLALFPPGAAFTASDGTIVRVRGDVAPFRGPILPVDGGWAAITITIPYRVILLT